MIIRAKKFLSSDLVKVFSYTGFSTLIKLITSYVTVKVVASIIGPSGVALVGQLQNFTSIFTTVGGGGINNGVVKYISEYKDDETTLKKYLKNGFKLTTFFSGISSFFLIIFSTSLSRLILFDEKYGYLFLLFGVNLMLLSFNNFFLSVLNGFKEFKKFVAINIFTNIISLIFSVILVWLYHIKGALIALVTYQGFVLLITIFYLRQKEWFSKELWGVWDKEIVKKYFSYSLMALVTAITLPVSQLLIRGYIIREYSIADAGFWEGINKISAMYLMFVTTSFSVYYLPKLAEIKDNNILRKEIIKTYKIITPLIFVTLVIIYFLKDLVINVLFTKEFYPMKELFLWQLIGDFFKIMSWLLAFVMVAKSMTKLYLLTEISFAISLVTLSYYFINISGVLGSTQSYCINYILYFIVMLLIFRKKLKLSL